MNEILKKTSSNCKLLVASIRKTQEITDLACNGVEIFTINSKIAEDIVTSPSTKEASEKFERDAIA